ncbi:MAG: 30S ribosomal protein S7 [Candidatus Nanoarchaeia archaeon]
MKLFGRWSTNVEVRDIGLKPYINLTPVVVPYSAGRTIKKQFWKSKKSIVERLAAKLMVPGHKGKKHYWTSNVCTGKIATHYKLIIDTFDAIEKKTNKNPIEVLVRALEAGTPREGIATIEYGGVRYPKAADMAPQRRIDLALRWMVQGAFVASRKYKKPMSAALADEIIATAANDAKANCIMKKTELERQAAASR